MNQTHLPPNWQHRLLAVIGAPATEENVKLLDAWARAEDGTARWNPLNTTYRLYGSTDHNSVHVQNYHRATEGVCAIALTLVNGYYNGLLGAMQGGKKTARQIVEAHEDEIRKWGTNPQTILDLL